MRLGAIRDVERSGYHQDKLLVFRIVKTVWSAEHERGGHAGAVLY
jgi:hypothetical protein